MLISLQILRAVAAALVALVHFADVNGAAQPTFQFGALGVDIFFVISGFVMVYASSRLFGQRAAAQTFMIGRLARIVPLYWSVTILGQFAYFWFYGGSASIPAVVCSFIFVPCGSEHGVPIYGVGWTLNYEMFFYALFAACIMFRRWLAVAAMSSALVVIVAVGAAADLPLPWQYWSHPIVLEFAFGAVLGLCYAEGLRLPNWICWALVVCGVCGFAATLWEWQGYTPASWHRPPLPRPVGFGVPALLVVAGAVLCGVPRERPGAIIKFMARLGDASYSIYLLHPLVVFAVATWNLRVGGTYGGIILDFAILLPASLAVYMWFERPMQRLVRHLLSGRSRPAALPVST